MRMRMKEMRSKITLMAARWIVCGMQRMREAEAENSIPAA